MSHVMCRLLLNSCGLTKDVSPSLGDFCKVLPSLAKSCRYWLSMCYLVMNVKRINVFQAKKKAREASPSTAYMSRHKKVGMFFKNTSQ